MDLSRIDLNLFTVFDAIHREGGITAAAKRLHLSQPAVSHALARLRELLDDPLFERRGNAMVPTPFARSLAATVEGTLGGLEQMLRHAGRFDPATSERAFTVAVRGSHELAFLPRLVEQLAVAAPAVTVSTVRIDRRDLEDDLQAGEVDLAIDVALPLGSDVRRERVSAAPLVVLARDGHPRVAGALDLDTYLALEHVLVTGRRRGGGHEDVALGRLGLARRIRVRCQRHTAAADIVERTDLLVTLPVGQAERINRHRTLQQLPFPADIPRMELFLYWHASSDADPGARWFRDALLRAVMTP